MHEKQLNEFEDQIFHSQDVATLVPCTVLGDVSEVTMLNKIVKSVQPRTDPNVNVEKQADPRVTDLVIQQM